VGQTVGYSVLEKEGGKVGKYEGENVGEREKEK
jgi:hypothetical protein